MREAGDAGFSMTELAARAGVSAATPYNLVGAKSEILRLVVRAEFDAFSARLARLKAPSPLARLIDATALVVAHYAADPRFYRGLFRAAVAVEASDVHDFMHAEGHALWSRMTAEAVGAGELEGFVEPGPLTGALLGLISMTTVAWFSEGWTRKRFALEMAHAVRLPLAAVATRAPRARLLAEIADLQGKLATVSGSRATRRHRGG